MRITAPQPLGLLPDSRFPSIFLGGGTAGPDWQREVAERLDDPLRHILNPRREIWPSDPAEGRRQIRWEHEALQLADVVLFWFPRETMCPITLFELGRWSWTCKPLTVGAHPGYARLMDVVVQMDLARPGFRVHRSINELVEEADSLARQIREARSWT
jgi:hypothetical protein